MGILRLFFSPKINPPLCRGPMSTGCWDKHQLWRVFNPARAGASLWCRALGEGRSVGQQCGFEGKPGSAILCVCPPAWSGGSGHSPQSAAEAGSQKPRRVVLVPGSRALRPVPHEGGRDTAPGVPAALCVCEAKPCHLCTGTVPAQSPTSGSGLCLSPGVDLAPSASARRVSPAEPCPLPAPRGHRRPSNTWPPDFPAGLSPQISKDRYLQLNGI